ncbi:MAG TPA: 2Fe-2S iron-sulfur cluster-binding protein, partial [Actinomycetota bacterium]|nr:2Fe-2S iron-sulfur cluster-binding protein [Actinomycetota bacterium]
MSERLPEGGVSIRRERALRFTLEGKTMSAFEGDTVGSALAAAGIGITGRSFKYHRPRGLFCMTGSCPNCLMQVDGVPNVRTCVEPVRDGMKVERQNAWPSVDRDIHGWLDRFSFMMPPGFYYKVFQHPRWAWPLVEPLIRSKAGLGTVPREEDHEARERITLHPDVLVIGGGAAGLAAAAESAGAGLDTLVLEQGLEVGGSTRRGSRAADADALLVAAESSGARILTGTAAFGIFEGPLVAAASPRALYRVRPRHLVVATGAIEQPAVFPNNDLPGVMLSSAVELLIHRFGVLPGREAVVMTSSDAGHESARALVEAGATVSVVDLRPGAPAGHGYRVAAGTTVLAATGRRRVTG